MSLWAKILGRFGIAPRRPLPREVLAAHVAALVERQQKGVEVLAPESRKPRRLSVVPDAGQLRVRIDVGLSRAEVFSEPGKLRVRLYADHFLPQLGGLDDSIRSLFQEYGLARPAGSGDFEAEFPAETKRAMKLALTRVDVLFSEVFRLSSEANYGVSIERNLAVDNSPILDSIRTLASNNDFESRRLLYQQMVNAWLYVPLLTEGESQQAPQVQPYKAEDIGELCWPVFTELATLRKHRAGVEPYAIISGIRLIQAARNHELGSVKINPGSNIGGELLAAELDTLADYLDSLGLMKA